VLAVFEIDQNVVGFEVTVYVLVFVHGLEGQDDLEQHLLYVGALQLRHLVCEGGEVRGGRLAGQLDVDFAHGLQCLVLEFLLLETQAAHDDEVAKVDQLIFVGELLLHLLQEFASGLLLILLLDLSCRAHLVGLLTLIVSRKLGNVILTCDVRLVNWATSRESEQSINTFRFLRFYIG